MLSSSISDSVFHFSIGRNDELKSLPPGVQDSLYTAQKSLVADRALAPPTSSDNEQLLWSHHQPEEILEEVVLSANRNSFFLPIELPPPPPRSRSRSSRIRQRYRAALLLWKHARRLIIELNSAWSGTAVERGCTEADGLRELDDQLVKAMEVPSSPDGFGLGCSAVRACRFRNAGHASGTTLECWHRVAEAAKRVRVGRRDSYNERRTGADLFSKLRKHLANDYGKVDKNDTYRPFTCDEIKENPPGSPVVCAVSYLEKDFSDIISSPEVMLRELSEQDRVEFEKLNKTYDVLGGEYGEWVKYLAHPKTKGFFRILEESEVKCNTAVLAVGRAKDAQLRKILAAVPFNFLLNSPRKLCGENLGMQGGTALGAVQSAHDEGYFCTLDESQSFTSVLAMEWMVPYQGCPGVRNRDLPLWLRRLDLSPDAWVRPCYTRLAMGNTWSVQILMMLHFKVADQALRSSRYFRVRSFEILNLFMAAGTTGNPTMEKGIIYIHVDDFIIGHLKAEVAQQVALAIRRILLELGFLVEYTTAAETRKLVGLGFQNKPLILRPLSQRLGDLDRTLEFIRHMPTVSPGLVGTALGVWVWLMLVWRSGLSAATSVFKWVDTFRNQDYATLWPSTRRDIGRMRMVLAFAEVRLGDKHLKMVCTQDAAGGSKGSPQGVGGSYSLALGFPAASDITKVVQKVAVKGLVPSGVQPIEDETVLPRTVIPRHLRYGTDWFILLGRRWRYPEHITAGESRSQLKWCEILGNAPELWDTKWLDPGDNTTSVANWSKGQSPRPGLNRIQQKRCSVEAVSRQRCGNAWIGSEDQPADWGTREGLLQLCTMAPQPVPLASLPSVFLVVVWRRPWWWRAQHGIEICCDGTVIWCANEGSDYDITSPKGRGRFCSWFAGKRIHTVLVLGTTERSSADRTFSEGLDEWQALLLSSVVAAIEAGLECGHAPKLVVVLPSRFWQASDEISKDFVHVPLTLTINSFWLEPLVVRCSHSSTKDFITQTGRKLLCDWRPPTTLRLTAGLSPDLFLFDACLGEHRVV